MNVNTLRLKKKKAGTFGRSRLYQRVSFHKRTKLWVAQLKGRPSPGSSPSQTVAATLVAKALKVPLGALRLKKAVAAPMLSAHSHRERFRWLRNVYKGRGQGHLSSDLEMLEGIKDTSIVRSPGLTVPFLLAKYTQHREAFQVAWSRRQRDEDTVSMELSVILEALRMLDGKPLPKASSENVGRNVSHHSGLVTLAAYSLGLTQAVRSSKDQARRGSSDAGGRQRQAL